MCQHYALSSYALPCALLKGPQSIRVCVEASREATRGRTVLRRAVRCRAMPCDAMLPEGKVGADPRGGFLSGDRLVKR